MTTYSLTTRATKGSSLTHTEMDANLTYFNNSKVVSVKDYGAVGDGVTDDTAAIQAAITAATSSVSKTIFIPDGVYIVSSQLSVSSACEIVGEGKPGPRVYASATKYGGAELFYTGSASSSTDSASFCLKIDSGTIGSEGNSNVTIRNIGISWSDAQAGGIYVEASNRVFIDNLWLCAGETGATADTIEGIGIYCRDMISSRITNCTFNYVAYGIIGDDYFNENTIEGCDFEHCTELGIGIYAATNPSVRCTIRANNFIGNGTTRIVNAISISGDVQQVSIEDNTFESIYKDTILINQTAPISGAALSGTPLGVAVNRNLFIANGGGLASSVNVRISAGTYIWVGENTIRSAAGTMAALVNIYGSSSPVFLNNNHTDTVALWAGNPPTNALTSTYNVLPKDSSETAQSAWTTDNSGTVWFNNSTSGAAKRSLRVWNGIRSSTLQQVGSKTDSTSDTTPDVEGVATLLLNPAAPFSITDFPGGYAGQRLAVWNQTANAVTITHGGNLALQGSSDVVLTTIGHVIVLQNLDGSTWVQIGSRTP